LSLKVVKSPDYATHSRSWDTRFDHNHLRISRIIRSLRILGLEPEAQAFRAALEECNRWVSDRSREYWRRAAERTLNLRPDLEIGNESDISRGLQFLCEFEESRIMKLEGGKEDSKNNGDKGVPSANIKSDDNRIKVEINNGEDDAGVSSKAA
jgi:hypothetical protein